MAGISSRAEGLTLAVNTAEAASPLDTDVSTTPASFVDADVVLTETLGPARGTPGICGIVGTTGIKGTAGLTLGLLCAAGGCDLDDTSGGTADEGVVGLVESASDGAWDVIGVSISDIAGAGGVASSCLMSSSSTFASRCSLRDGNSTGILGDCGALRFRRRGRVF